MGEHPLNEYDQTQVRRILDKLVKAYAQTMNYFGPDFTNLQAYVHWHTTSQRACSTDPEGFHPIGDKCLDLNLRQIAESIYKEYWHNHTDRHLIFGLGFRFETRSSMPGIFILPERMEYGEK